MNSFIYIHDQIFYWRENIFMPSCWYTPNMIFLKYQFRYKNGKGNYFYFWSWSITNNNNNKKRKIYVSSSENMYSDYMDDYLVNQ